MKSRSYKKAICFVFMMIFLSKMVISVAPVFLCFESKTINAVIMQLELENKNEKEDPEKDGSKEKKFCDEIYSVLREPVHVPYIVELNLLFNQEHTLYQQVYHPTVPTPPPNPVKA